MCALVRRSVTILHRELATAVTNAEEGSLELGLALLSLPDIHLADPPYLAVPCSERIDSVGLGALCVAGFLGIANAGPEAGQVEIQAVVVFRPTWALEGDEFRVRSCLYLESLVDRMR